MKLKTSVVVCAYCGKEFERLKKWVTRSVKVGRQSVCSLECRRLFTKTGKEINCHTCKKPTYKFQHEIESSKSGFSFCSTKCAAIHSNAKRRKPKIKTKSICRVCLLNEVPTRRHVCSQCKMLAVSKVTKGDLFKQCTTWAVGANQD